jgi:hypothetical protein
MSRVQAREWEEDKPFAPRSGSRCFFVLLCLLSFDYSATVRMATATTSVQDPLAADGRLAPHAYPPAPAPITSASACAFASDEARQQQQEEDAVELPPVDRGWGAWSFVAAGFMLDMLVSVRPRSSSAQAHLALSQVWGHTFSYGSYLEYYVKTPPFDTASTVALSAVGTTALALNYAEILLGSMACRRWPHLVKRGIWFSLLLYVVSLLIASFATQVWTLVLFQVSFRRFAPQSIQLISISITGSTSW